MNNENGNRLLDKKSNIENFEKMEEEVLDMVFATLGLMRYTNVSIFNVAERMDMDIKELITNLEGDNILFIPYFAAIASFCCLEKNRNVKKLLDLLDNSKITLESLAKELNMKETDLKKKLKEKATFNKVCKCATKMINKEINEIGYVDWFIKVTGGLYE